MHPKPTSAKKLIFKPPGVFFMPRDQQSFAHFPTDETSDRLSSEISQGGASHVQTEV